MNHILLLKQIFSLNDNNKRQYTMQSKSLWTPESNIVGQICVLPASFAGYFGNPRPFQFGNTNRKFQYWRDNAQSEKKSTRMLRKYLDTTKGPNSSIFHIYFDQNGQFKEVHLVGDSVEPHVNGQMTCAVLTALDHRLETNDDILNAISTLEPAKWVPYCQADKGRLD